MFFNYLFYIIKNWFGYYGSNEYRTINIHQYDGVQYSYEVHKDKLVSEIIKMFKYAKSIKIS